MDVGEKSGRLQLRTFLEIFQPTPTWEKEILLSAAGEDAGYSFDFKNHSMSLF